MRFSERIGKKQKKVDIQIDSIDQELKNGIWNILCMFLTEPMEKSQWISDSGYKGFIESIWFSFFKEPIDQIPYYTERITQELRKRFFTWDYLEIYDFIDFVASSNNPPFDNHKFIQACDYILKRELSGYRFVSGQLAPITSEGEILEIEKAISESAENNLKGVHIHLTDALAKLSDKKSPDYRNSIKESIENSDLVIIHTEWNDFKSINFKNLVKGKKFIIYDMRNIYSSSKIKAQGFKYFSVGR